MEIRAFLSYRRKKLPLAYWRSTHGFEVDFLIGRKIAIEVKTARRMTKNDFKGLKAINEEGIFEKFILVSQDRINTRDGNFLALHWEQFLSDLWEGNIV